MMLDQVNITRIVDIDFLLNSPAIVVLDLRLYGRFFISVFSISNSRISAGSTLSDFTKIFFPSSVWISYESSPFWVLLLIIFPLDIFVSGVPSCRLSGLSCLFAISLSGLALVVDVGSVPVSRSRGSSVSTGYYLLSVFAGFSFLAFTLSLMESSVVFFAPKWVL